MRQGDTRGRMQEAARQRLTSRAQQGHSQQSIPHRGRMRGHHLGGLDVQCARDHLVVACLDLHIGL